MAPVAIRTVRPLTTCPSSRTSRCMLVLAGHRADLDRGDELGPELQGLEVAPVGQVRPGQSGGESHVVLDPRAGPGLTARAEPVEDDGGQPLGGTVDGRREAGRPGPDDHQVERLGADLTLQAQALGQPGDRGARRARAPVAGDERQLIRARPPAISGRPGPPASSASIQVCGTLFLSKNSRITVTSGSPRCPKTRTPTKPERSSMIRRVWNASSSLSLRSGISWMTRRSSAWLTQ